MSLIFFGTPQFAVPSLKALIEHGEEISLVFTQPDKVKGRGHILSAPPVKELALSHGLRVLQPQRIRDEEIYEELRAIAPELIIVVAYGKILPREILDIPRRGCINVHGSILPKYRGAAPIQRALLNGEEKTGVTTMLMDTGMDTGDMLLLSELEIRDDDTSETLFTKLSGLGAEALIKTIEGIRAGTVKPLPQSGEPTYSPPLTKEEGRMDWNRTARQLSFFVRGMTPWPSAYCYLQSERIKVLKVTRLEGKGEPGRVEKASQGELVIGTADGLLRIDELQPEGKKAMPAGSFLAGRKLKEKGDVFS
ncbi:MAG: methionyl-tRNA formyltransferase [Nitrospirales bacterium]|nr:methionyl-tRNA formyltransferase [Nitrospirales bacterium]